jgi:hypothetical protein
MQHGHTNVKFSSVFARIYSKVAFPLVFNITLSHITCTKKSGAEESFFYFYIKFLFRSLHSYSPTLL